MSAGAVENQAQGWIEVAALVMFAVGGFRVITAIAYFAHSRRIDDLTNGLFSNHVWAWGVWDLVIAATAIGAGYSLLAGGEFGRVIAYIWGVLMIVQGFTTIDFAPWLSAMSIALAVLVIYGLAVTPRTAYASQR
jgi:hypothetical protein